MHHLSVRLPARRRQRGVATLMIVMVLFFVVSLVAAYASRNLIFEQRTSANQYRATQAFEAAEAGLEWAVGLLNGGRVDATCAPTGNAAFDSFRSRYLRLTATGGFAVREWMDAGVPRPLTAACVRSAAGWSCSCPSGGVPAPALPAGEGSFPAFLVAFEPGAVAGQLRIRSTGCSSYSTTCLNTRRGTASDAAATVISTIGLASAMPTAPAAALTVRGKLAIAGLVHVANPDPATNGVTIHTGQPLDPVADIPNALLETAPGGVGGTRTVVDSDPVLAGWSADRMFTSFFGVDRATFKRHPSTVVLDCAAGCGETLAATVAGNPGRPIWVAGDLAIDSDTTIGSAAAPVLLVVTGKVDLNSAGARIVGVVYSQAANWASSGTGNVQGAVLAEGNLAGPSLMSIQFDAAVVDQVRLGMGSMVRVPGGWRDF